VGEAEGTAGGSQGSEARLGEPGRRGKMGPGKPRGVWRVPTEGREGGGGRGTNTETGREVGRLQPSSALRGNALRGGERDRGRGSTVTLGTSPPGIGRPGGIGRSVASRCRLGVVVLASSGLRRAGRSEGEATTWSRAGPAAGHVMFGCRRRGAASRRRARGGR